jgi:phosphoserine phosphatase RsbU/P
MTPRRPWHEELEIIDRTMRAISGVTDPEELVNVYWSGIGELLPATDYLALSRRNVEAPFYLITRSVRFTEQLNPWTQRDRLPRLSGGLLGEIAFAEKPVIIEDLPSRLSPEDPAHFYLDGYQSLVALPQYDSGQALNITVNLLPPGLDIDYAIIPMLHWQAGLFGRGTQNLVLRNQLSAALANLDRELKVVGEIQRSLLPSELPAIAGFDIAAYYLTSARAGGDYYDFFPLSGGRWGLFIADVSGHGTPAAVLMAITHAIAHSQPGTHTPPAALLAYLNAQLTRSYTSSGTFITAFYAVLDPGARTLTYSTAGHNPPRLVRGDTVRSLSEASSLPLGIMNDQSYTEATIGLSPGELLVLYTDGITEAMAPTLPSQSPDLFGTERLDRILIEEQGAAASACVDRVCSEIAAFTRDGPASDDRTLIVLKCR